MTDVMSYDKAVSMVHDIYDIFDKNEATIPEGMTVLIMALLSVAQEHDIGLEDIIRGLQRHHELHRAMDNPHKTLQ